MSQQDDEYWASALLEARRGQLDTVRKAAASWSTLFTAVLGVFTTVTFVSGLPGLNELSPGIQNVVRGGVAVAAVATLIATVLAGAAANSFPKITSELTFAEYRKNLKESAETALNLLRLSMVSGAVAGLVVIAGSFVLLFANKSVAPTKPPSLLVTVNGASYCGELAQRSDGTLEVGPVKLSDATSLAVVDACPETP